VVCAPVFYRQFAGGFVQCAVFGDGSLKGEITETYNTAPRSGNSSFQRCRIHLKRHSLPQRHGEISVAGRMMVITLMAGPLEDVKEAICRVPNTDLLIATNPVYCQCFSHEFRRGDDLEPISSPLMYPLEEAVERAQEILSVPQIEGFFASPPRKLELERVALSSFWWPVQKFCAYF
jgi:hypothetical protein